MLGVELRHLIGAYCYWSSESLMSLTEHRLLLRVLPVPALGRHGGHKIAVLT